jgi:hypothetical protein
MVKAPRTVNDDTWSFNSQVSTQWDGLRHFGYQDEELFYGGVGQKDIHHVDEEGGRSTVLGIQGMLCCFSFILDAIVEWKEILGCLGHFCLNGVCIVGRVAHMVSGKGEREN